MITLEKVRGKPNYYWVVWKNEEGKTVSWPIDGADLSVDVLQDIINTVRPPIQPTAPAIPLNPRLWPAELTQEQWDVVAPVIPGINSGAEAADKAAREEEQRLMNMGSALAKGINLGPEDIPVFEDGGLPEVNWSQ